MSCGCSRGERPVLPAPDGGAPAWFKNAEEDLVDSTEGVVSISVKSSLFFELLLIPAVRALTTAYPELKVYITSKRGILWVGNSKIILAPTEMDDSLHWSDNWQEMSAGCMNTIFAEAAERLSKLSGRRIGPPDSVVEIKSVALVRRSDVLLDATTFDGMGATKWPTGNWFDLADRLLEAGLSVSVLADDPDEWEDTGANAIMFDDGPGLSKALSAISGAGCVVAPEGPTPLMASGIMASSEPELGRGRNCVVLGSGCFWDGATASPGQWRLCYAQSLPCYGGVGCGKTRIPLPGRKASDFCVSPDESGMHSSCMELIRVRDVEKVVRLAVEMASKRAAL